MPCCRWDAELNAFEFYGESEIILSPNAVIEASVAGQATKAAGLAPTTVRKIKVFSAEGTMLIAAAKCTMVLH
jgi:hypothetical protein